MKITIVHGQSHKGVTYALTHAILERIAEHTEISIEEFFLPKDGPDFCIGCNNCFLKGEGFCPSAKKMQPIAEALERADVIMLDSPNYVMEMNGGMKNLMDHFAYRWVTHRPVASMYRKVGVAVSSSAGAPAGHTVRSMARQLKWMGCPTVCLLPFTCNAFGISDLSDKKCAEMERKTKRTAKHVLKSATHPRASLRARLLFMMFRKMQSAPAAAWNPKDRDWWVEQGWTKDARPWNI